jgi:hypothetical protein
MFKNAIEKAVVILVLQYCYVLSNEFDSVFSGCLVDTYSCNINSKDSDLKKIGADAFSIIRAPSTFETKDYIWMSSLLSMVAVSPLIDNRVRAFRNQHFDLQYDRFLAYWRFYGDGTFTLSTGLGIYLAGLVIANEWFRETGRDALSAVVYSGIITGFIKFTAGRARPEKDRGAFAFEMFNIRDMYQSYPSGHTTNAFAFSSAIAARVSNPFAKIGLYSIASLTAAQRIYSDRHWFSDVLAGALIGTFVGNCVAKSNERVTESKKINTFQIIPDISSQHIGLLISTPF